jgi:hypothetical protein
VRPEPAPVTADDDFEAAADAEITASVVHNEAFVVGMSEAEVEGGDAP